MTFFVPKAYAGHHPMPQAEQEVPSPEPATSEAATSGNSPSFLIVAVIGIAVIAFCLWMGCKKK